LNQRKLIPYKDSMTILSVLLGLTTHFHRPLKEATPAPGQYFPLLAERAFEEVYLFSTPRMASISESTKREIVSRYPKTKAHILEIPLKDPTNYLGILRQLRSSFRQIHQHHDATYSIAVSSGTPQMHACWLMLVASGEIVATILQTTPPEFLPEDVLCLKEIDLSAADFPKVSIRATEKEDKDSSTELSMACKEIGIIGSDPAFGEKLSFLEGTGFLVPK
jgi:sigma54-dependent transcription regulator